MRDVRETKVNPTSRKRTMLPVTFINREGDAEMPGDPASPIPALAGLSERAAKNRLRRALFETGQLIVTPKDQLTRVCFAGVGDPERLFVESVPRDVSVPAMDHDFPGCLCSLSQAETLLRRIYRGESSDKVSAFLDSRSSGRRQVREAA